MAGKKPQVKGKPENKLTKKQEMFCREYAANGHNGTKAAISAGYSKKTANEIAAQNLAKLSIQEFIKKLEKPVMDKLALDNDWVLRKLKIFSDAVIIDYFDISKNSITLKDFSKIEPDKLAAIESIKETRNGLEIKLIDKRACVVDIGRHLGMFKDAADRPTEININVNGVKQV